MADRVEQRAAVVFGRAHQSVLSDAKAMHAEHSAKGLLGSGATIKRAVRIFEERSREALTQIHSDVANVIEHRGRRWTAAMADIERQLETDVSGARALLATSFTLAGANEGAANEAGLKLINEAGDRLRAEHAAFRDGWTAPPGKPWRERHALLYALLLLVAGGAVAEGVKLLADAATTHRDGDAPTKTLNVAKP